MNDDSEPAWKRALLRDGATIEEAVRTLDQSAVQIALVVEPNMRLKGTITDGDIRRGLLKGLSLSSPINQVINRNPFVGLPSMSRDMVMRLMQANRIHQLPVVNEEYRVLGLHLRDELDAKASRPNPMVIMAGGLGTRLRPYTEQCPKPMLPVSGKPMLERIIDQARAEGFEHFIIAVRYLAHQIEHYFKDGSDWGVRIEYVREEEPLGTAGALSLLPDRPEVPLVVTNGDVLTNIRYGELLEFHVQQQAIATMAVRLHEWQNPYGVVKTRGMNIVGFEEKPVWRSHINAGVYAISVQALSVLDPSTHCDMPQLFEKLKRNGHRIVAYPMHESWLDVGRPEDLDKAQTT